MKISKIICTVLIVFIVTTSFCFVFGANGGGGSASQSSGAGRDTTSGGSDDFWNQATDWFSKVDKDEELGTGVKEVVNTFSNMISVVGTTVFVIVTIFLGIKYMYGSVEAKASVKESLTTLLVACIFFFGWNSIRNLLFPNNNFIFIESTDTSYEQMVGRIFAFATYIAQFLAIIGIVYVGVRYIFAGAEGKATLKGKSTTFLIGIILTFCATSFLSLISDIVNDSINSASTTSKYEIVQEVEIAKDENILLNNIYSV